MNKKLSKYVEYANARDSTLKDDNLKNMFS